MKNRKGFTLIELMIIIAIIGILLAVFTPSVLMIETQEEKEERTLQECGPFVIEC